MGTIYLIRHGQAPFRAQNYDVLPPFGVQQSEILSDYLINIGVEFTQCFSGDMSRQKNTAQIILSHYRTMQQPTPQLSIDSAFNEINADAVIRLMLPHITEHEPYAIANLRNPLQDRKEFQYLFAIIMQRWATGQDNIPKQLHWSTLGGTVHADMQRILETAQEHEHIGIFTSCGTITAYLHLLRGRTAQQTFELNWQIVNTSLNRLKFRNDPVAPTSFNSHPYLDLLKNQLLITYR